GAGEAQLVRGVVGGDLVALGQGGVVEDGLQEVVEAAAQAEHGLADVDQLGGLRADAMGAQQPAVLAVEDHLEQPRVVTQDPAPGELSEGGRSRSGGGPCPASAPLRGPPPPGPPAWRTRRWGSSSPSARPPCRTYGRRPAAPARWRWRPGPDSR